MNIVNYFLLFVVTLAIVIFAIVKVWNTQLAANKGINVFIIIFIVITVLSFLGIGLSRNLQSHTTNIMPTVGKIGVKGSKGVQGDPATSCNCTDDNYYKKVMQHVTLVYNEWNRVNGYPTIPINKYIKNKYFKNKINMICNSKIFGNLVRQNGTSKFPYTNFKKGILKDKIEMCDIRRNCGAFDLLLETCRKWVLIILKYEKGKYFLDSEELTDRDFDTLITDLDLDQSSLPGYETGKVNWVFVNPIIFPNIGVDHKSDYNAIRNKYVKKDSDNNDVFDDDAFEKDNITLYDFSDNVKFQKIDASKRAEFYRSDFYKFYSVPGVVSVDGKNTHSPFDEIKMFDVWYWGANEETRPKLIQSCDTVYDDPERKYNNISWDLVDTNTGKSVKPLPGSGLNDKEISQWGTSDFDNFSPKMKPITVQAGVQYKLVSGNTFDTNERWYGAKLEIKDGGSSSLVKLNYIDNDPITFKNNKIRIRFKPDFEFYDQDTPKIKIKISNDYDEIWNNLNKRQMKLVAPENISGTSLCKYKDVFIPYRNKGNVIKFGGNIDDKNERVNFYRAKDFSDKDEKELKYKYYKPLGDVFNTKEAGNTKLDNNDCRPYIDANTKQPVDFRKNGPKTPSILVSGDVVRPKSYKRQLIRKRHDGVHKNDFSYSFWEPEAPEGYVCLGDVVSSSVTGKPPSLDAVRCLPSQCVEELTPEKLTEMGIELDDVIQPKWTTRDYKIDPKDSRFKNYLENKDPEAIKALTGDGWRCGIKPSLSGFEADTDYHYNIDDLSNKDEISSNNNKDIDLFVNHNVPNIQNIGKDYDFSVDSENLLLKYNIFKSRGFSESKEDPRYILKTTSRIITFNNNNNNITLETQLLEDGVNQYYNSIFFKKEKDKFILYFNTRSGSEKLKKYIKGTVDPTATTNETEATRFTQQTQTDGTIELLGDQDGVSNKLSFSENVLHLRKNILQLQLETVPLTETNFTNKIFTRINGIKHYLYENSAQEIKFTTNPYQATVFFIKIKKEYKQISLIIPNTDRFVHIYYGTMLKTTNVIPNNSSIFLRFEGDIFTEKNKIKTLQKFKMANIGYKTVFEDKFFFEKYSETSEKEGAIPKFYKIRNQCIYNPKEYKYKKPEITVGEKYGKDYSVLKIYD